MYIQPLDKTEGAIKHGQSETPVTLGTCHRTKTKNKKETHTTRHQKRNKKNNTFTNQNKMEVKPGARVR